MASETVPLDSKCLYLLNNVTVDGEMARILSRKLILTIALSMEVTMSN